MASFEDNRASSFLLGFVDNSRNYKAQYIDVWREVLENYMVTPYDLDTTNTLETPYSRGQYGRGDNSGIVLKDPETHKVIMTYASRLLMTMFSEPRNEYIKATAVGWEDAPQKQPTVTRLLRYCMGLPGQFRALNEAIVDMLLFGTAIVEIPWIYLEREQPIRSQGFDSGVETPGETRGRVVSKDDPYISVVDNADFFPDPGEYILENMCGAAKRFRITAQRAKANNLWRPGAVEKATKTPGNTASHSTGRDDDFREGVDQPYDRDAFGDFSQLDGFEYWGEVPWDEDGSERRVITVLNNVIVRNDPYPLADPDLPWRAMVINPSVGRFYGKSPAEVIRWDQSLQDAVKELLAMAIIRKVRPPIAYDPDSELEEERLRVWSPDVPIPIRGGPSSVGALKYDADVFTGFQLAAAEKQTMQEASGALPALTGEMMSSKRMSATESQIASKGAEARPEAAAVLLEKDFLPLVGKSILRRYQQFLVDTDDLKLRVGEMPESAWIGDILGDFDIQFVGSRMAMSRQQKLQAYDRLISFVTAVPQFAPFLPMEKIGRDLIGNVLELEDIAAAIGENLERNVLMQQLLGAGGANNNGQPTKPQTAGASPQQTGGAPLG